MQRHVPVVLTRAVWLQRQTGLVFAWSAFFIWSQEIVKRTLRTREQAQQVPRLVARIQTSLKSEEKLQGGHFSPQDYIFERNCVVFTEGLGVQDYKYQGGASRLCRPLDGKCENLAFNK